MRLFATDLQSRRIFQGVSAILLMNVSLGDIVIIVTNFLVIKTAIVVVNVVSVVFVVVLVILLYARDIVLVVNASQSS